jgi:hypothetical protein
MSVNKEAIYQDIYSMGRKLAEKIMAEHKLSASEYQELLQDDSHYGTVLDEMLDDFMDGLLEPLNVNDAEVSVTVEYGKQDEEEDDEEEED